jgi:outer membrane protein
MRPLVLIITGLLAAPALYAADLVGVHDAAVNNDPQLRAAEYRRDASGENTTQARANFLPTISGSASHSRGDSETSIAGMTVSDVDTDTDNLGFSLVQTIYNHANYGQLDQARALVSQADADYAVAYQDFLFRVADRYFSVLTAIDGVTFAEAEEKALQRQFEQAEQRFDVGLTAVTDVHEARAGYDNARARAIVARNNLDDANEGLRELAGRYFEKLEPLKAELPLVMPTPATSAEWVELAIANSPAIFSRQKAADIAEANIKLQKSGHYPTLSLRANYNQFDNNEFILRDDFQTVIGNTTLENDSSSISLQLDVPIYSGGATTSRSRQAGKQFQAALQDLEAQRRATVRQTQNAFREVTAGIQQVEAFQQALVSATSALEATEAGFEVGTRTIVDVLIAEQRYFQAQRDYSSSRHSYVLGHLRLRSAAGVLEKANLETVATAALE